MFRKFHVLQEVCVVLALCAVKSGKIMAFKFPVLKPKTIDCSGLPAHDFKCMTNKEIIGKGAYGAVFTADWRVGNRPLQRKSGNSALWFVS